MHLRVSHLTFSDISSLHIIPAQVALKQAQYMLKTWRDTYQPPSGSKEHAKEQTSGPSRDYGSPRSS